MPGTPIVGPNSRSAAEMAASERLGEIATILAVGALRARQRVAARTQLQALQSLEVKPASGAQTRTT